MNAITNKKAVGKVSTDEINEIKLLFERKNGLTELFKSMLTLNETDITNKALYDKLVADMGEVSHRFQTWWKEKSELYAWEGKKGHKWEIDFNTGEILLVKE